MWNDTNNSKANEFAAGGPGPNPLASGIVAVTSGNNTVSFTQDGREYTVTGFSARPGYNLATGLGTVDARYFVPELAGSPVAPGGEHAPQFVRRGESVLTNGNLQRVLSYLSA